MYEIPYIISYIYIYIYVSHLLNSFNKDLKKEQRGKLDIISKKIYIQIQVYTCKFQGKIQISDINSIFL